MAYVYPRLPRSVALQHWEMRVQQFGTGGESPATLTGDAGFDPLATFDPTGMRVTREILEKLRDDVLEAACDSGFPLPASHEAYRTFEMKVGRILLESADLMPGEGGQPDIWSHMALVLLPDVAFWRWADPDGKRKARFVGGIRQLRNIFEVCWFRALVLDDPSDGDDRLHLMAPLTQDAMVSIVERASLARCRPLARSLARAFPDVAEDPGSLSVEDAFRVLCKRMTLVGAVVNFDVLDESEIHELVLQQLGIVRGSSQPASDARGASSPPASSGPSRPVSRTLPEIRSEDSRSEPGEEMEATAVAEQPRSVYGEAGVALAPSGYEDHRFWGPFYNAGVPEYPEFERCTPTGALPDKDEKIAPYLCSGYQVDIRYARSGNCCRLLNLECIDNNDDFERQVGGHVKWNPGGTVTVEAAPRQEQKTWSMERRVMETLGVYGNIKKYVLQRVQDPCC